MKSWDDDITREDLEIIPGIIDQDTVRMLSINTYLMHMWEFVENDVNQYAQAVLEHMEDVMMMNYISFIHASEGRSPDPDEVSAYLNDRDHIRTREYLTYLCYYATRENWPDIERHLREQTDLNSI